MAPAIAFLPLIAAGIGAAATVATTLDRPSAPAASTVVENQTQQAQAQQAAAIAQASALEKRRGMASTILTSPMGAGSGQTTSATLGT